MGRRNSNSDFVRDVGAQSSPARTWTAVQNADSSFSIQLNGVQQYKVLYNVSARGGAVTDANPQGDNVTILFPEGVGVEGTADAQAFIQNLK